MPNYQKSWRNSTPKGPSRSHDNIIAVFFYSLWGIIRKIGELLLRLWRWFWKQKGLKKKLLLVVAAVALIFFIVSGSLFIYYSFTLPSPDKLLTREVPESTKIFDRNGELLYEIFGEAKRTIVPLDQVPDYVKEATISIEDKDFYKHGGIDLKGILRAITINIITADPTGQGASTITQQFVGNAVLNRREKSYIRKLKEAILSIQLERRYSKDEILQLYLNEIPYGSNAYGVEAASQVFFGKHVQDLTLAEASYLAALPKGPTYYSPYGPHREDLDARADTVLALMQEQGYITEEQKVTAQQQEVEFSQIKQGIQAPHFVLYIQDLLAQKYGEVSLREGGFRITTTLDLNLQKIAEEVVSTQVEKNEERYNAHNASLVAIDPRNGQILAMVGSRDYFDQENDGAVNVALRLRQPGSSFKPYVYATAFKQGMNPATLLMDVKTNFGNFGGQDYIPNNYDGQEHGPVSIRQALQGSLNIPAVKTMILVGVDNAINTAERMGITTLKDRSRYGPSLVLGGGEVRLLEHTAAFGVFATGGIKHETTGILKVEDKNGKVLEEYEESRGEEALDPQVAYQINNVLSDNNARAYVFGQNNLLTLPGRPAAAKTGTTQESRDAWTVGYVPKLVTGVWVGNNDNSKMSASAGGSSVAAPIWHAFMAQALAGQPAEQFSRPEGITELSVDTISGKLPSVYTPSTKTDVFASFNTPEDQDDVHVPAVINGQTQIYTVLHSERPDDPAWEQPVIAWAETHGYNYPPPGSIIETNGNINIKLNSPSLVTSLPWALNIEADSRDPVVEVEAFLDNNLVVSQNSNNINYSSTKPHANGPHQLMIRARTTNNQQTIKNFDITFQLGSNGVVLIPDNGQQLIFPTNIILETNQDASLGEVKFWIRSQGGVEIGINGNVTKQRTGNITFYTLNWATNDKPSSGVYQLYGQINGQLTPEITVTIP